MLSKAASHYNYHHNPCNFLQIDQTPKPLDISIPHLPVPYLINPGLNFRIYEALYA